MCPRVDVLLSGNYTPVPLMAGACANDGTLVLSEAYSLMIYPNGFDKDTTYLKYRMLEQMFRTANME